MKGFIKFHKIKKKNILDSYLWLTDKFQEDTKNGKLSNYNQKTAQGRMHFSKDKMTYDYIKKAYMKPFYQSHCPAGRLFGIIDAKGQVFACEILEKDMVGDLKKENMDFLKIWNGKKNKELRKFITDSKCNCTYEMCAIF